MKEKNVIVGKVVPAQGIEISFEYYPELDQMFMYSSNDEGDRGTAAFSGIKKTIDAISAAETEADIMRILARVFILGHKAGIEEVIAAMVANGFDPGIVFW